MIDEKQLTELTAWLAGAGLAGKSELALVFGFLIDTLHPVHEGRIFRWGHDPSLPSEHEYGRTNQIVASGTMEPASGPDAPRADVWRGSTFYRMRETGESLLRRRIPAVDETEFNVLPDLRAGGFTDYVAIINRFAADGTIGEMDCVYSSWATKDPDGFQNEHVAALQRIMPFLALAIKSVSLTRMTGTLMQTYLGRDAGRRVLSGRIVRGVADRIDAVLWFSDLRGFTRITLKFMGDGTLAIFPAGDRERACDAALAAAVAARQGVIKLNKRRVADGLPITEMYLGLHVGEVFYGNVGSTERLDFTVIGPAVNEVSRIAAMCRSVEQPMLVSAALAASGR